VHELWIYFWVQLIMAYVATLLDDVRHQIAASDEALSVARLRRDETRLAAYGFPGSLRTYRAGSLANGTVNRPVHDADCGLVLNRRHYPALGPDGDDVPPNHVVELVRQRVWWTLKRSHPYVIARTTKRAILIEFGEPIAPDEDPAVDLIVALTRREAPGLWIPNLENRTWDASHPERHTELFTSGEQALRTRRARVVRLAKAWNGQYQSPVLSSFNIQALALECVNDTGTLASALANWFDYSARELSNGPTKDPAGVSPPIRILAGQAAAVTALETASGHMNAAISASDPVEVKQHVHAVFPHYISEELTDRERRASALALGNRGIRVGTGWSVGNGVGHSLKPTRAYGTQVSPRLLETTETLVR
jgi:hypothetical protein